jgi:hypothetical protein
MERPTSARGRPARVVLLLLLLPPITAAFALPYGGGAARASADEPAIGAELEAELEEELEGELEEEGEEPEAECDEIAELLGECEAAPAAAAKQAPEECPLSGARARASSSARRLQLVLHYTAVHPVRAYVDFRLRSPHGALRVGIVRRRLAGKGLLRLSETLSETEWRRTHAAATGTVQLDVPGAPARCRSRMRLELHRAGMGRDVWRSRPIRG